jgi:hypothetical protein
MRNRWEGAGGDLDDPVTLTERDLRSLKRGAGFGMLAVFLALCALALAAWSLPEARSLISGITPNDSATSQSKPADSGTAQAAVPSSAVPSTPAPEVTPTATASAQPAQPAAAPEPPSKPVTAAARVSRPASPAVQTRAAVTRKGRSRTTQAAFTSTPTPEPFSMETSKPVAQPVAQDSSISLPAPPTGK